MWWPLHSLHWAPAAGCSIVCEMGRRIAENETVLHSPVHSRPNTHVTTVLLGIWPLAGNWVLRMFLKHISQMLAQGSPQSARRFLLFWGKVRKWVSIMINWFYWKDFSLFRKCYSVLCRFFYCERSLYAGTNLCPVWIFCGLHFLCSQGLVLTFSL